METVSRQTNQLDPWYVTGFVEGEGCFTYSRNGDSVSLYFAIKLTATDEGILVQLRDYFGVGKIYDVVARSPRKNSGWTKAAKYYRCNRAADLVQIIRHFDQYPLTGVKAKSYAIWREMVIEKAAFRKASKEKLAALATQLSQQSPRNQAF